MSYIHDHEPVTGEEIMVGDVAADVKLRPASHRGLDELTAGTSAHRHAADPAVQRA